MSETPAPSRSRQTWFKLFVVFGATGLGLLAWGALMLHQERLVIAFDPFEFRFQEPPTYLYEDGYEVSGHRYLFDKKLGWRNVPGLSATTWGKPLNISRQGFRDREYPLERTPGAKRMLVLGDSFVWGYGVGDSEIFTEVLERELNAEGKNWEIINTGVSGWGTDQEYLFLRDEGRHYQPDIVVLAYFLGNDWGNNVATVQYFLGKPCFTDTNLTSVRPPRLNPGKEHEYDMSLEPVSHSVALVHAVHDVCREIDARMLFIFFGALGADAGSKTDNFSRRFVPLITRHLEQRKVAFIDIDIAFGLTKASRETIFGGNSDGHWNAKGHAMVAGFIYHWLQQNPL